MKVCFLSMFLIGFNLCAQAQWLAPLKDDFNVGAAYVEKIQNLKDATMTVKLFHTMPIDAPSMNPWFLRLAVVDENRNTWNVYELPNNNGYQVLPSAKDGYLKIALIKDDYNSTTGKPFKRKTTLFINLNHANRTHGQIEIEEK